MIIMRRCKWKRYLHLVLILGLSIGMILCNFVNKIPPFAEFNAMAMKESFKVVIKNLTEQSEFRHHSGSTMNLRQQNATTTFPKFKARNVTVQNNVKHQIFEMRIALLKDKHKLQKLKVLHGNTDTYVQTSDNSTEVDSYYRLSNNVINPINHEFLLMNPTTCSTKPFMIVLVPSSAENVKLRRVIRLTYGRFGLDIPVNSTIDKSNVEIRVVYVIGKSKNETINYRVRQEFKQFKDIILANFVDTYFNLTLKVLLGLRWIQEYCPNVKYVHKVDDDVFLNIPLLISQIEHLPRHAKGAVYGTPLTRGLDVVYLGKWGISKTEYPLKHYPPYAQGTSYTLTGNLVDKIVNTSQYLPYLHIEDAFITGIIACKIHGAALIRIVGSSNWGDEIPKPCKFVTQGRVAQTKMSMSTMFKTWYYLNNPKLCKEHA